MYKFIHLCKDVREFPGSLVVKIWWFHCRGLGSIPGQGTEILQANKIGRRQPDLQKCNRANPRQESQQQKAALTPSTVRLPFLRTCLNLGEAWTKHSSTELNQAQFGARTKLNWTKHSSVKLEPSTVQPNWTRHSSVLGWLPEVQCLGDFTWTWVKFGAWVTSPELGWSLNQAQFNQTEPSTVRCSN